MKLSEFAKLKGVEYISSVNIDDLINTATSEGKTIPKSAIYKNLKKLRQQTGGVKIEGASDARAINRIVKSLDEHLKKLGKDNLTPAELQKFKQDAYTKINFDRKQGASKYIKEETHKALAKGAKEGIEGVVPEVGPLNAQLGDLLDLKEPIQRSAQRIENLNLVPLTGPLNIGAGSVVGGPTGGVAGLLASILEMPKVKAKSAIGLDAVRRKALIDLLTENNMMTTAARQTAYESGKYGQAQNR